MQLGAAFLYPSLTYTLSLTVVSLPVKIAKVSHDCASTATLLDCLFPLISNLLIDVSFTRQFRYVQRHDWNLTLITTA